MSSLKDRDNAFENKFANDEKLSFEVEARGSKIFGLWIAEKIGLAGDDASAYASSVVAANLDEPGFDDIMRKVKADLSEKNIEISDHILDVELNKAMEEAKQQLG